MSIEKIIVQEREITGKEEAGRIKRKGLIPAVVYGLKKGSVSVSVSPKEIAKVYKSEKGLNSLLELSLGESGKSSHVMIKDLAKHPVTDNLIHVDFLRVDVDQEIEATVPLFFTGIAEGVKLGGILQVVRHEILVSCKPDSFPGRIDVAVDHLEIDDSIRVSDLAVLDGVEFLLEGDRVLAGVHEAAAEEVEEEVEDTEAIEGEGEGEGEGEAGEAGEAKTEG